MPFSGNFTALDTATHTATRMHWGLAEGPVIVVLVLPVLKLLACTYSRMIMIPVII